MKSEEEDKLKMEAGSILLKFSQTPKMETPPARKRPRRVLIACKRCQQKKRKCDGQTKCILCIKSNSECVYEDGLPDIIHLERKESISIANLQAKIDSLEKEKLQLNKDNTELFQKVQALVNENQANKLSFDKEINIYKKQNEELHGKVQMFNTSKINSPVNSLNTNVLSESLFSHSIANLLYRRGDESDEYIGSFALISIVQSIRKKFLGGDISLPKSPPVLLDNVINENLKIPEIIEEGFLQKFLSLAHNRYYFLEAKTLKDNFNTKYEERTPWDNFCVFIALGIGCRLTELQKVTIYPAPEFYLKKSLQELLMADLDPIKQIQACSLIAVFVGRSYHLSFFITSWELSGIALRKLIQYGFHRKQQITLERCLEYEFHKKLFWSVFGYEKLLSLSLGRPCGVSESFVDIPEPVSYELPLDPSPDDIYMLYKLQLAQDSDPSFKQPVSCFTALIETRTVRNIESKIHVLFYSVHSDKAINEHCDAIFNEIESWFKSLPTREEFDSVMRGRESYDYFELLYYRAQLLLYISQLMKSNPSERSVLLDKACIAAGSICTCYKNLYREMVLEFSVLALHTVFLAGVTLVYYLRNKGYPNFMNMQNSIRACISLLFVFSERWSEAISYRDLFDHILEQAEQHRQNPITKKEGGITEDKSLKPLLNTSNLSILPPSSALLFNQSHGWISPYSMASNADTPVPNFGLEEDFWDHLLDDINVNNDPQKRN